MDIEIQGVAEAGDTIRVVGVRGGYDEPMLVGQKREDEKRGLPAPDGLRLVRATLAPLLPQPAKASC